MAPYNQSIHPGLDTSSYMDRPSMKQEDHPAHNMPTATEDYRGQAINSLRTQSQQSDASNWRDAAGKDSRTIDYLVRGSTLDRGDDGAK